MSTDYRKINYKNKNIGSIAGCYCPPHKGHYNSFLRVIREFKLDVLFIETTNTDRYSRHGTPLKHSLETLRKWAKCIERETNAKVFVLDSMSNFEFIPRDISHFYAIQIYDEEEESPKTHILERTARRYLQRLKKDPFGDDPTRKTTLKDKASDARLPRNGKVSATKFVNCLMDVKTGKKTKEECHPFIDHLKKPEMNRYIDSITAFELK